jgi:hypothetical protein
MDRRELTGARSLQTGWSALALLAFALATVGRPALVEPIPVAGGAAAWLVGLGLIGLRDRRAWVRLARDSTFEPGPEAGYADLRRELKGYTVTVSADVPLPLGQTHAVVSTTVATGSGGEPVEFERIGEGATGTGVEVGNPALDGAWVIDGPDARVTALLSTDVQAALMDVTVPLTVEVADGVVARVPFTRLRPAELGAVATAVATLADRVERLDPSETPRPP